MFDSLAASLSSKRIKSALTRLVSDGLMVRPGEGRRTGLLFALLLTASSVFVLGRTVRDTLFLSRYSLRALPWMFVLYGVASAITAVVYARVADKLPRARMMMVWSALGIGTYLGTWGSVRAGATWVYPVFYVWSEVFANLLISQFWTLANDLHDARSARRLFGTIGAARMAGIILVGLGTGSVVKLIGTPQLLFVLSGLLVAVAGLATALSSEKRVGPSGAAPRGHQAASKKPRAAPSLAGDPYVIALSVLLLCTFAALTIGDYQFKAVARGTYREDSLARFFSYFYAGTGIVSFLFQVFVTPRLLARFGVGLGMSVMPVVFGAASATLLGVPMLPIATVMKFADNGFQYSIHETSLQALYVPFSPAVKLKARALLDAVVKPASYGLGGILLVLFAQRLGTIYLSLVSVPLVVGWLAMIPVVRRRYMARLESTLRTGELHALGDEAIVDAGGKQVLLAALESDDPRVVLAALDELGDSNEAPVLEALERLAGHRDPAIRVAALSRLGPHARATQSHSDDEAIDRALKDPVAEVRAAAAEAVAQVHEDDAIDALTPMLEDASRVVRTATLSGLLSHCGFEGAMVAGGHLAQLLTSKDPADRVAAARALGALGHSGARKLMGLLRDPERRVRLAAVRAARECADPRLIEGLLACLRDPSLRSQASTALAAIGAPAVAPIVALLHAKETERTLRLALPRVLRGIETDESYRALKGLLHDNDSHVRLRTYAALSRLRERLGRPPESIADVRAWVEREISETYRVQGAWQLVGPMFSSPLLDESAEFRAVRGVRRVMRVLELRYPRATLSLVRERLEDPKRRANALEVLDTTLEPSMRPVVMPFFDEVPIDEKLARAKLPPLPTAEEFLREQARHPNPFVAAIVIDALSEKANPVALVESEQALAHSDALVREAGVVALARLDADRARTLLVSLCNDPNPQVARIARNRLETIRGETPQEAKVYSTIEKLLMLRSTSIFEKLTGEDLAPLARVAEEEQYQPGESIFDEGAIGDALYVIVRGKVAITRGGKTLATLGAGEPFGEMAVLDASPRSAGAVAVENTELLRIGSEEFYEVLHEQVEIAEGVIRMLSQRLRKADEQLHASSKTDEAA